jgi:hypothetical protein
MALGGCARSPAEVPLSRVLLDLTMTYAAPVSDAYYYYLAIDTDDDTGGLDGPIPVATGPYIANGWGTGSITHFLEYNLGQYQIFRTQIDPEVLDLITWITSASGSPDASKVGDYVIKIDSISGVIPSRTANVSGTFTHRGSGITDAVGGTVTENSVDSTLIPGLSLQLGTFGSVGDEAKLSTDFSDVSSFFNYPFDSIDPGVGNMLRATVVLVGEPAEQILPPPGDQETINFNFISTNELLLDPNFPGPHYYDGLGFTGTDYVTISVKEDRVYRNSDSFDPEDAGDTTTGGIDEIDLLDWTVQVRFLR